MHWEIFRNVLSRNFVGLISLVLGFFLILANSLFDKKQKKYLILAFISTFCIVFFDMFDGYFELVGGMSEHAQIGRKLALFFFFLSVPLPMIFVIRTKKNRINNPYILYISYSVFSILNFISLFVPIIYDIDSAAVYTRVFPLYECYMAYVFSLLCALIYYGFSRFNSFRKFEGIFLTLGFIFVGVSVVWEIAYKERFVTWNTGACILCLYYCSLLIQGYRYDGLTGLLNRETYFTDYKEYEDKDTCFVYMMDLNNLKIFNDKSGHLAGDQEIVRAAHFLKEFFWKIGTVYRFGGDEFLVIVPNKNELNIEELDKSLRKQLIERSISLSSGYAYYAGEGLFKTTVDLADKALYKDKENFHTTISK